MINIPRHNMTVLSIPVIKYDGNVSSQRPHKLIANSLSPVINYSCMYMFL